jgi:signal transduction histidine kinase
MLTLRPLQRYQLITDLGLAVVFGVLAFAIELATTPWRVDLGLAASAVTDNVGAVLTAAAFTAAVAMRRLHPGVALSLAWVGALVQMAFSRSPSPSDLAIFATLYTSGAYGSRRVFWAGFASAIAGAVTAPLYLMRGGASTPLAAEEWFAVIAVMLAAGFAFLLAWVSGALVRTAKRAAANSRAQRAAEAEAIAQQQRVQIARDMHDVVAHSLAVVIAQADGARYAAADPDATVEALTTISSTARSALGDVRLLLAQLRHSQGDGPQPTLADTEVLFERMRAAGIDLQVEVDPEPPGLPPAAVQLAVYRILQEALTNALRHGVDPRVRVHLAWWPDRVVLSVRNARPTSAPTGSSPPAGHGLIGMRERAQLVGGHLTAGPEYGEFAVRATLPTGAME